MSRRTQLAVGIALIGLGCAARGSDLGRCEALGDGTLERGALKVRVGSRVEPQSVAPGPVGRCDGSAAAQRAFIEAHAALAALPARLAPARLDVHVVAQRDAPRLVEFHSGSRALLVAHQAGPLPRAVWVHEIGHVSAAGPRPDGRVGRRLLAVVDEAFADYYAAIVTGSPRVAGGRGEVRDLDRQPAIEIAHWAALALAPASFDPHLLGHGLAAALYAVESRGDDLLRQLRRALSSPEPYASVPDTPAAILAELVRRMPTDGRDGLRRALIAWAPAELIPDTLRVAHER